MRIRPSLLVTLGLLSGLTPFAIDMYLPSLPAIAQDLDSTIEMAQLTVTLYLAIFALAQLFMGPLSDMLGRRATIGGGLILFSLGALGCALAGQMEALLGARMIQAAGGAAIAVTVPALVRDLFERDHYARVIGLVMMIMSLAPLLAPSIGGVIVTHAGWPWVFIALLGIALVASAFFWWLIPETLPPERRHPPHLGRVLGNYYGLLRHRLGMGYLLTGAFSFGGMMTFIVSSPYVYIVLYEVPTAWFGVLFGANVAVAMLSDPDQYPAGHAPGRGAPAPPWPAGPGGRRPDFARPGLSEGLPPLWAILLGVLLYLGMTGLVLGNAMASYMVYFVRLAGTASAFSGAARFGFGAVVGTLVSLAHDGSARPLLLGMALSGLMAGVSYWLLCREGRETLPPVPLDATSHRPAA
jgi:DHA1 family bicyclomycin/chloramphenicol resistance-like MFS transporter